MFRLGNFLDKDYLALSTCSCISLSQNLFCVKQKHCHVIYFETAMLFTSGILFIKGHDCQQNPWITISRAQQIGFSWSKVLQAYFCCHMIDLQNFCWYLADLWWVTSYISHHNIDNPDKLWILTPSVMYTANFVTNLRAKRWRLSNLCQHIWSQVFRISQV